MKHRSVVCSVIDVTKPESPVLVNQLPSPTPGVTRCNSLGLSGNVLVVANQAAKAGGKRAGMWILDVSDIKKVSTAKSLDELSSRSSTRQARLPRRTQPVVR